MQSSAYRPHGSHRHLDARPRRALPQRTARVEARRTATASVSGCASRAIGRPNASRRPDGRRATLVGPRTAPARSAFPDRARMCIAVISSWPDSPAGFCPRPPASRAMAVTGTVLKARKYARTRARGAVTLTRHVENREIRNRRWKGYVRKQPGRRASLARGRGRGRKCAMRTGRAAHDASRISLQAQGHYCRSATLATCRTISCRCAAPSANSKKRDMLLTREPDTPKPWRAASSSKFPDVAPLVRPCDQVRIMRNLRTAAEEGLSGTSGANVPTSHL